MTFPITFQRWCYRDKNYYPTPSGKRLVHDFFNPKTCVHNEIWMSPWLVSIVFWLPRAWNRLTHRYYYGRLTYQYELGLAHGRRDVLRNFDTYRDLSQAEIDAITQDPDHN